MGEGPPASGWTVGATGRKSPGPIAETIAGHHDLADDFARRQIAHQPLGAGMAERSIERAADLPRYAKGAAPGLRYVHARHFVQPLIVSRQPHQPRSRAVDRHLFA